MKTILVFKTSVTYKTVNLVKPLLNQLLDTSEKWNFDLEDCDRILRVESFSIKAREIEEKLKSVGLACIELDD